MMNSIRPRVEKRKFVSDETLDDAGTGNYTAGNDRIPRFIAVLREKGHEAMRNGRVQTAVQFYSQALGLEISVPLLCHRAEAYLKLNMHEDTIHDCTKIIKLQPKAWQGFYLRASALRERGEFADAIADFHHAKKLCPKRSTHVEKLVVRCRRAADSLERSGRIKSLVEEGRKQKIRPFVKGDKRVSQGQALLRVQESIHVIFRVLENPGLGAAIWKEEESDRWGRMRLRNPSNRKAEANFDYDKAVVVQRLEMLQYFLQSKAGREARLALGSSSAFSALLAAYEHHDLRVLEVIYEALRDGDDTNMHAFMQARPLPTVAEAFQAPLESMRSIACALLDLIASYKCQKTLTLLMNENLIPQILTSMRLGSATEHAHSVSLFFKLALDPRLVRHLSSLPCLSDLCEGLSRACGASQLVTRLRAVQAIVMLLDYEKMNSPRYKKISKAVVIPARLSPVELCNEPPSLLTAFVDGGVLKAVALLLARESEQVPEKAEVSSSIWEEDVELICEEITKNVSDFSEMHECTLRDFDFISGHAQIAVLSAVRAMDFMASADCAVEVLDQLQAWGLFIPLLSSFPDALARISVKTLAKFCQRSKRVALHIANLWPANSSLIVLELARSAHRHGDSQTYQAAMLILAELAACKSFLASMQKPTSFTVLVDFLQDGKSTTVALTAICTCLTVAVTSSSTCVEFAELKAYALGSRLLQLWCEYRAESRFRWQVENLMFILMDRSGVLQKAILCLLQNGIPSNDSSMPAGNHMVRYYKHQPPQLSLPRDEDAAARCIAFSQNRKIFETVCSFLSTVVQPSTKFADLCPWAGLLSIQVAKHFKTIHCYSVNLKRSWVEHTRRLAKQEAVQNLTAILCKTFEKLPQSLPADLDVAILCLSLDMVDDLGRLFRAVIAKLQHGGKLVLIDDKEELMIEARLQAVLHGLSVLVHSTMGKRYFVLLLQRSTEQ